MLLDVTILNPKEVLFQGQAKSIILPGETAVFEVAVFHKRLLSRLISGTMFVDDKTYRLDRGIIKVNQNKVVIIIEKDE